MSSLGDRLAAARKAQQERVESDPAAGQEWGLEGSAVDTESRPAPTDDQLPSTWNGGAP